MNYTFKFKPNKSWIILFSGICSFTVLTILLTSPSINSSHTPETRDHSLLPTLIISPYNFAAEFRSLYILLLDSSLHSALYYNKSFVVHPPLSRPLHIYLLLLWGNWLNSILIMPVLLLKLLHGPQDFNMIFTLLVLTTQFLNRPVSI